MINHIRIARLKEQLKSMLFLLFVGLIIHPTQAQLVTMSNKCYKRMESVNALLEAKDYDTALSELEEVLQKCSAKDAQEQANVAKASAYNSLGRCDDAVEAANAAVAVKETSINALFQRGSAYTCLGQDAEAKADFDQIIALTEKNENKEERASIFAALAEVSWNQGNKEMAYSYMNQALFYNSDNIQYHLMLGDWKLKDGQLDEGFAAYDKAEGLGLSDLADYTIIVQSSVNAVQQKYGTTNANELAKKMSAEEKGKVCGYLGKAFDQGMKDMQLDLFKTMLCK